MRFAFDPNQSEEPFKGNRCFFNCQCLCCRQGCCVVVVKCCCCFSFNCCSNISGSRKSFLQPALARKKVLETEVVSITKLMGAVVVLARWATALATILTRCILQDIFSVLGQFVISDGSRSSSRPVHVSAPTTPNEPSSSNAVKKLKIFYGYTSYEINNDQQMKSNNLCTILCNSHNRKRQRRKRRRRRRRRRRHRNMAKRQQAQRTTQKKSQIDKLVQRNDQVYQQRLRLSDDTCQSLEANFKVSQGKVSEEKLVCQSERSVLVSPLREIISPWSSTQGSMRNCSKNKRNRANLIWLLIGLVWFEVKLINCNGISSNYYASNLETHKGCTLCHEGGKLNIYNDKGLSIIYNFTRRLYSKRAN
ncbi:inhibin beta chain isoform X2 [Drosophila eugracilis]|uniref:inhibin beta chain isoform X2 n=1 Tax=Drosophila eugracilis TaxID=29029 RepID=UPI001BDA89F1|nr:inhibin beta chain isoform X2 [Drosophila eugracilis]